MARLDARVLVLVPLLLLAAACGSDEPEPEVTPSPSASVLPPSSAPAAVPEPTDSVFVEEEPDPTDAPGDLSDEAQALLDEALGIELGALESAPPASAQQKREILDRLPDNPSQVLTALRNYQWLSPEAKSLYDKAVKS